MANKVVTIKALNGKTFVVTIDENTNQVVSSVEQ